MQYNEIGLGVFSFDRAAQGLYRLKELYSHGSQQIVQPEEVVRDGDNIYLRKDHTRVEERWELRQDNKPKIRTTSKKVWAYFPKFKHQRAAAEIYISCGNFSSVNGIPLTAENFLYSGLVGIVIAKQLIAASIPVKINAVIGWENENNYTCAVVPVKNYDDPLDVNLLAMVTSDPRFWRYEGFKACSIMQQIHKRKVGGVGLIGSDLQKIFEGAGYKTDVPNRFYFGRVKNEQEAIANVQKAITQISASLQS